MNLSEIVDRIIDLQQHGASAESGGAEYLESTLRSAGAQVQTHAFTFSVQTRLFVAGAIFLLSIFFFVSVLKRRHRSAFVSALTIPLILLLEFHLNIHVVSWPFLEEAKNIVVHFPVQDAARTVIVGTHIAGAHAVEAHMEETERTATGQFAEMVWAFLSPITLVITVLGAWQLAMYFGKLDFEDAHTIVLIMGAVCVFYYALMLGMVSNAAISQVRRPDQRHNAGSIAVLTGLAQDLSRKYPRLQNTWVTVAFFGGSGSDGHGAGFFARNLPQDRRLPTYFIGCEEIGRGGLHGYVIPESVDMDPLYADRELVRTLNRAAVATTGHQLETTIAALTDSKRFVENGYPAITITTLPRTGQYSGADMSGSEVIDRGQLLLSLQLIERSLLEFEKPQFR
ncbi:MAG: hypothetical protein JSV16_04410 [Candidatus Hydrogenedentota bacterium]|nr:MAG: hypothetical protein JSV16_04410 [Candidatus Hydrogenedentota bacterium]